MTEAAMNQVKVCMVPKIEMCAVLHMVTMQ